MSIFILLRPKEMRGKRKCRSPRCYPVPGFKAGCPAGGALSKTECNT
jgi:hypothetical protein